MKLKTTLAAAAILALAAPLTHAQSQGVSKTEITLGSIQDLSGPLAGFGKQLRNGMMLRVNEVNEQGGVHGRKINLLVEKGWVVRGGNDYLTATRKSAEDLQPLTEASIQYIAQMVRLFREVMPADAGSAGKPPPKRRA